MQALVTQFVNDLKSLLVGELLAKFDARGSVAKLARVPAKRSDGRAKGEKRSPDQLVKLTHNLLAYVSRHPGLGIEQIGTGLDTPTRALNLPMKKLLADKRIKTKGQKRATKYFAA